MKTAISILKMKSRSGAFTIIELLMVIAIMAVVAGLIVGLAAVTGNKKKISRAQTEKEKLVMLIEDYKAKVGVYPPDNFKNPGVNSLLYELAGAIRKNPASPNPVYETPFGSITKDEIWATYGGDDVFPGGRAGLVNAVDESTPSEDGKVHRILKDIRPDMVATVAGHRSLVIPVDGPAGRPNPWRYAVGTNATHNPESFDLWVDIIVRGGTNRIGNWKN